MKKFVWPLLIIFFLLGGLVAILVGKVAFPLEVRSESVQEISEKWETAGHSDRESLSFTLWNNDDPAVIPFYCAKCHSEQGYLDFLGADGSQVNVVDGPAPVGSVVSCLVCHNTSAHAKDAAIFPSGVEIDNLGMTANCIECHQGRESTLSVEKAIVDLPEDEINEDLNFINVHYKVDAATRYGSDVAPGYQYPGKTYDGFFPHVKSYQLCTDCHDPHSTSVTPSECASCHPAVTDWSTLRDIRVEGRSDFDGDGDTTEGIHYEITTLHNLLYSAIQNYADEVIGQPIAYTYRDPKWVVDTNANGSADADEINTANSYASWTPRLVKATYNYHYVVATPGGFAHNANYVIQILVDTIEDLLEVIEIDVPNIIRP